MSSRQLRKLRKQQELQQLEHPSQPNQEDDDSEGNDEPIQVKSRPNIFAGFAALGDEGGDDNENSDEDDDEQERNSATTLPEQLQTAPSSDATKPGKKKPKKKKKKKKAKSQQQPNLVERTPRNDDDLDEIDRALNELKVAQGNEDGGTPSALEDNRYTYELARLLKINDTHLKVLNEMRNLFGKETIQAAQSDSDPQVPPNRRRMRQGEQHVTLEQYLKGIPGNSIPEVLLRRNLFIQGKEYWPRASAGGLSMTQLQESPDDTVEFAFTHTRQYDMMEASFFAYVQMHDPMQLVHFLRKNPYHVSTLIQVSKVAKQDQNSALAGDLCERALFTFGRVTLSRFRQRLKDGRARLNFNRPENRQFWLTGYNYIRSLIMKGTYRTALEWAKLFVQLAPADDYGIVNFVHTLAVRAFESRWLLALLRSDAFSSCMDKHIANGDYIRQTAVLAALQVKDRDGARVLLEEGLKRLPWLYCSLFSILNLDIPKAIWGIQPRDKAEELYTELYISLTKDLWNNPEATALLRDVAGTMPRPSYETLPRTEPPKMNTARFVYLDNTPSLMALLPKEMLHVSPNFDFDPLPPKKEDNVFSSRTQGLPWEAADGGGFWASLANMPARHGGPRLVNAGLAQGGNDDDSDDDDDDDDGDDLPDEPPQAFLDHIEGEQDPEARGMLRRVIDMFWPGSRRQPVGQDEEPRNLWDGGEDDGDEYTSEEEADGHGMPR